MIYTPYVKFESKLVPGVIYTLRKMSRGRRNDLMVAAAPIFSEIEAVAQEVDLLDKEFQRAQDAAKLEPCTCNHSLSTPLELPEGFQLPDGVEIEADTYHVKGSGRCIKASCGCRIPKMDPEIGTEQDISRTDTKFWALQQGKLYPVLIEWGLVGIEGLKLKNDDNDPDSSAFTPDAAQFVTLAPEDLFIELGKAIYDLIRVKPEDLRDFKWPTTGGAPMDRQTNGTTAPTVSATSGTKIETAGPTTLH